MRRVALALALTLGFFAIATPARGAGAGGVAAPTGAGAFPAKAVAKIIVSQDEQTMFIFEGDRIVRRIPISTGWPGSRITTTPAWHGRVGEYWGTFESYGSTQDLGYWLFTDFLPDGSWNGDILLHGAPYLLDQSGQKAYVRDGIGQAPASHGCIRLHPEDAEWFHAWDPVGVPIEIGPFTRGTLGFPKLVVGVQAIGALAAFSGGPGDPNAAGYDGAP